MRKKRGENHVMGKYILNSLAAPRELIDKLIRHNIYMKYGLGEMVMNIVSVSNTLFVWNFTVITDNTVNSELI